MHVFGKQHFTPAGQLMFACVFHTDTGGKFSDDKYKVTLRLPEEEAKKLDQVFRSYEAQARKEEGISDDVEVITPMKQAETKNKETGKREPLEGFFDFQFKTQQKPTVIDGKKQRVTANDVPGAKPFMYLGKGVVCIKPFSWSKSDRRGTEAGISAYLQAIQVIELGGNSVDLSGFDEIDDGFSISGEDYSTGEDQDDIPDFAAQ